MISVMKRVFSVIVFLFLFTSCNPRQYTPEMSIALPMDNNTYEILPGIDLLISVDDVYATEDLSTTEWSVNGVVSSQKGSPFVFNETEPGIYTVEARLRGWDYGLFNDPRNATDSLTVTVTDKYQLINAEGLPSDPKEFSGFNIHSVYGERVLISSDKGTVYFSDDGGNSFASMDAKGDEKYLIHEGEFFFIDRVRGELFLYKKNSTTAIPLLSYEETEALLPFENKRLLNIIVNGQKVYVNFLYSDQDNINKQRLYVLDLAVSLDFTSYTELPMEPFSIREFYFTNNNLTLLTDKKEFTIHDDVSITESSFLYNTDVSTRDYLDDHYNDGQTIILSHNSGYYINSGFGWNILPQEVRSPKALTSEYIIHSPESYSIELVSRRDSSQTGINLSYPEPVVFFGELTYMSRESYSYQKDFLLFNSWSAIRFYRMR